MPDRDNNRDIRLDEARLRIKAGLEALAKGDFVEGTAAELYEQTIARARLRLKSRSDRTDEAKTSPEGAKEP